MGGPASGVVLLILQVVSIRRAGWSLGDHHTVNTSRGFIIKLADKLGWRAADVQPWLDGTFPFDADRAGQVAQVLQLDVPMFVGKALEVTLRSSEGGHS
jgi:hypothetical protein